MKIHKTLPSINDLNWEILGLHGHALLGHNVTEQEMRSWWSDLFGTEPEQSSKKKKSAELSGGGYTVHSHDEFVHWLQTNVRRGENLSFSENELPNLSLGTVKDGVMDQFNNRMKAWFLAIKDLKEFGTGISTMCHFENASDALKLFDSFVPGLESSKENCMELAYEAERKYFYDGFALKRGARWTASLSDDEVVKRFDSNDGSTLASCILQIRVKATFDQNPTSSMIETAFSAINALTVTTLKTGDR
ncbi:MAG: hypothetical protein P4L53_14310 [Candidatus Obscuribacterales bacterium]|nr:hypothetical protein [Candidatus Obscuribacterales bacterium]